MHVPTSCWLKAHLALVDVGVRVLWSALRRLSPYDVTVCRTVTGAMIQFDHVEDIVLLKLALPPSRLSNFDTDELSAFVCPDDEERSSYHHIRQLADRITCGRCAVARLTVTGLYLRDEQVLETLRSALTSEATRKGFVWELALREPSQQAA